MNSEQKNELDVRYDDRDFASEASVFCLLMLTAIPPLLNAQIRPGTVMSRLARARGKLKERLAARIDKDK